MASRNTFTAQGVAKLLPYANSILGAIEAGGRTQDIWAAVQAGVAAGGPSTEGATIFDMNELAARLRSVVQAQTNFEGAPPTDAITADMWSWAPWVGSADQNWLTDSYHIRYQYQVTLPDGTVTPIWGQTDWQGPLDVTAQAITDRAMGSAVSALDTDSPRAAEALGGQSGGFVSGITAVQILRV